jgi:N-acyl homoserine lactone hydrolase
MAGTATKLHGLDCGSMSCDDDRVTEEQYLDRRLAQLGLGPENLDDAVFSHLHFDHAGNAKLFGGDGPRLVVNDKEQDWAFGFEGAFNGAHLRPDYEGLEFETVSGDTGFLPWVTLIEAPGHNPGTMALRVDLADEGTMLFTSDAIYMGDSCGPPDGPGRRQL